MLTRFWAARWYLLLGLLTFLITFILTAPLHFLWRYAAPQLQGLPLRISQVSGTLWQGRMQVEILPLRELGVLNTRWSLAFWPLLTGSAQLQLEAEGADVRLSVPLQISPATLRIDGAEGYLDLQPLQPLLSRQRSSVAGQVELLRLLATVDLGSRQFRALSGRLQYSGGPVSFLVDNKPVNADMPPLIGQLGMEAEQAALQLTTQNGDILLSGYLQPDGWAGMALRRRFIDVLGQPWPASAEADTVIFEVSRKVL